MQPAGDAQPHGGPPPQASTSSAPRSAPDPASALADGADAQDGSQQLKKIPSKMFRCNGFGDCQMTFTRSEHLARHVRKHTGERPFKCHCGREFSRLDNVRQHAATVHSDLVEKNAQTIQELVALHNQLSVSTVQRQRDAGMILQDGSEARSRRRAEAQNGEPKPKKPSGKKRETAAAKKAREQAEAAESAERQKAAEQDAAMAAAQACSLVPSNGATPVPQHLQQQQSGYSSPYGTAQQRPPQVAPPAAYPYGAAQYPAAAPPFTGYPQSPYPAAQYAAPYPHQQMYGGAIPPPNMPFMPGMEMYAATAAPGYPQTSAPAPAPPTHNFLPQPPSPRSQRPAPVDPQQQHQHQHANARYNPSIPHPYAPTPTPPQADTGQLTPNKISLPSISALLPSPFANGQQQQGQGQQRESGSQPGSAVSADPHAAQHQQQQAYYAAMSAAPQRQSAQASPAVHPAHAPPHHAQYPPAAQYGMYPGAAPGEMQYHHHQQQQQQAMAAHGQQPHPFDPYARPSSTTGSEREGPPSLSNGSSSATSSSFQSGSPHHPHLVAPHNPAGQHYSHLYNPAGAAPAAYPYGTPPQAQAQPTAYPYAAPPYLSAQQSFAPPPPPGMFAAPSQEQGRAKYAMHQPQAMPQQHGAHAYGLPPFPGGRDGS
ncbi:hypothetical protein JCM3770_004210 [Rhodotorula araucariae]